MSQATENILSRMQRNQHVTVVAGISVLCIIGSFMLFQRVQYDTSVTGRLLQVLAALLFAGGYFGLAMAITGQTNPRNAANRAMDNVRDISNVNSIMRVLPFLGALLIVAGGVMSVFATTASFGFILFILGWVALLGGVFTGSGSMLFKGTFAIGTLLLLGGMVMTRRQMAADTLPISGSTMFIIGWVLVVASFLAQRQ